MGKGDKQKSNREPKKPKADKKVSLQTAGLAKGEKAAPKGKS